MTNDEGMSRRGVRVVCLGLAVAAALSLAFDALPIDAGGVLPRALSATPAPRAFLPIVSKFIQPNFVIIVSDDQRYDTIDYMPLTKARIFDQGLAFTRAYATTPLCCPSRSSILTGQYAHKHQVYDNFSALNRTTFIQRLHDAGYYTGIVGKYLNSWDGSYRPEFDFWVVSAGHGSAQRYYEPWLNLNGAWVQHGGYVTYILRDYALSFLNAARQRTGPFLLIFTPNAPHFPATPAPGDENLYPDLPSYRPPSFMEEDMSDKPQWLRNQTPVDPGYIDALRQRQLQSLHALDLSVSAVLDALDAYGLADRTVVVYLSDNGVFWAEHRMDGKLYAYEEAAHVPFAIRYPPLVPQPRVESRLVANIDLAPTIYELAGLPIPPDVDGRSLTPLLTDSASEWRDWLLIEGWGYYHYMAVRTDQFLYVETDGDISELYDSATDPYQLQNQHDNPAYAVVVNELHNILSQFLAHQSDGPHWRLVPFVVGALGLDD